MKMSLKTEMLCMCFLVGLLVCGKTGFAQAKKSSDLSLYVHGLYGFPLEKSSKTLFSSQFGGVAGLGYGKKNTILVGSIGYSSLSAKSTNPETSTVYIPLKAGVRQYLPVEAIKLFGQGDVGVGFLNNKSKVSGVSSNDSRFAFDLGVGAKIGESIETAIVWDNFKETGNYGWSSWVTIHLGWTMNF